MMPWFWSQSRGELADKSGMVVARGYAGNGVGKNNPEMQFATDVGPLPQGCYLMVSIFDSPKHGPSCIRLLPLEGTHLGGRAGFLIHGDAKARPGHASQGCICIGKDARLALWQSTDHQLVVTP